MIQYPLDHWRLFDGGDELDRAATFRTDLHINLETRLRRVAHFIAERCLAGARALVWVDFVGFVPRPPLSG